MIKKVKGGYKLFSHTGQALSKKVKTKAGAARQETAINISKAKRARSSNSKGKAK